MAEAESIRLESTLFGGNDSQHDKESDLLTELEECKKTFKKAEQARDAAEKHVQKLLAEKERLLSHWKNKLDEQKKKDSTLSHLAVLEKCVIWSWDVSPDDLRQSRFKFCLGGDVPIAQLQISTAIDSYETMVITQASADVVDLRIDHHLLQQLLNLVRNETVNHVGNETIGLLLHRVTRYVTRFNSLINEIKCSDRSTSSLEFTKEGTLQYVLITPTWSCIFDINGLDLATYPSKKLTFTLMKFSTHTPTTIKDLIHRMALIEPGEHYITRFSSLARRRMKSLNK